MNYIYNTIFYCTYQSNALAKVKLTVNTCNMTIPSKNKV